MNRHTLEENSKNGITWMSSPGISARHAFSTRSGGASTGIYSSLNLGEWRGDENGAVRENYRRICEACGFDMTRIVFSKQVHEAQVRPVTSADVHTLFTEVPYEADGLMTDEKGLVLVIFTADCVPVLLHDEKRGVIAAVHAGWRGTVADIAGRAVNAMSEKYGCVPGDIKAAIGPSIDKCCFETGEDVANAARELLNCEAERFIVPKNDKYMVDLRGMNGYLLERAGLSPECIAVSDECTMCLPDKYWSHRYTNGMRGSMASFIMM